jgi:hypothetical protein
MSDRITNWTRSDDAAVEQAIRRGATRRELLHMMLAGGVALSAGSAILGRASQAVAATPRFRRFAEGGGLVFVHGRYARPGESLAIHGLCPLLRALQPAELP